MIDTLKTFEKKNKKITNFIELLINMNKSIEKNVNLGQEANRKAVQRLIQFVIEGGYYKKNLKKLKLLDKTLENMKT